MFAEAMLEMMKTMELEQVRVSALCKLCHSNTPTFYYYFHDKYELVAWIYLNDYSLIMGNGSKSYSPELLNSINKRLEEKRSFYQKAFADPSQNNIEEYLMEFNLRLAIDVIQSCRHGMKPTDYEIEQIKYHNYGNFGMFREWLYGKTKITSLELSSFLFEMTPDFLKDAFSKYYFSITETLRQASKKIKKRHISVT